MYRLICGEEMTHSMHRQHFDWFRRHVERFLVENNRERQFDIVREYEDQLRRDYRPYIEKESNKNGKK